MLYFFFWKQIIYENHPSPESIIVDQIPHLTMRGHTAGFDGVNFSGSSLHSKERKDPWSCTNI